MPQYPQKQIGQYKGPGWNVAPPSAGGFVGSGGAKEERAKSFAAFSQTLAGAGAIQMQAVSEADVEEGQRRVLEGEAEFRRLEKEGLLDWTPAMMRGAKTMQGRLEGKEFIRQYTVRMDGLSDEEAADPEAPARIFDEMLATHHAADREPNTYYDDGFNLTALDPDRGGRAAVQGYTSRASKLAKEAGLITFGTLTHTTVLDAFAPVKGLDPEHPLYSDMMAESIRTAGEELSFIASGDGTTTDSGNKWSGGYGDGYWTANNGAGALKFVEAIIAGVLSSGQDPQVAIDMINNMEVGGHQLSEISQIKGLLAAYTAPGGDFKKHQDNYKQSIMSRRTGLANEWDELANDLDIAVANVGDEVIAKGIIKKMEALAPRLFIDPEKRGQMFVSLRKYHMLSIDNLRDHQRTLDMATARELAKKDALISQVDNIVNPNIDRLANGMLTAKNASEFGEDIATTIDSLARNTDLTDKQLRSKYAKTVNERIQNLAEELHGNRDASPEEKIASLTKAYVNQARSSALLGNVQDPATNRADVLWETFRETEDPNEFLDSPDGLELSAMFRASMELSDGGGLKYLIHADSTSGNLFQRFGGSVSSSSTRRDYTTALLKARVELSREGGKLLDEEQIDDKRAYEEWTRTRGGGPLTASLYGDSMEDVVDMVFEASNQSTGFLGINALGRTDIGTFGEEHLDSEVRALGYTIAQRSDNPLNEAVMEASMQEAAKQIGETGVFYGRTDDGNHFAARDQDKLESDGVNWYKKLDAHSQKFPGKTVGSFIDYFVRDSLHTQEEMESKEARLETISVREDPELMRRIEETTGSLTEEDKKLLDIAEQGALFGEGTVEGGISIWCDADGNIWLGGNEDNRLNDIVTVDARYVAKKVDEWIAYEEREKRGGGSSEFYGTQDEEDYAGPLTQQEFDRRYDEADALKSASIRYGWDYKDADSLAVHNYKVRTTSQKWGGPEPHWTLPEAGFLPWYGEEDNKALMKYSRAIIDDPFTDIILLSSGEVRFENAPRRPLQRRDHLEAGSIFLKRGKPYDLWGRRTSFPEERMEDSGRIEEMHPVLQKYFDPTSGDEQGDIPDSMYNNYLNFRFPISAAAHRRSRRNR